MTTTDENTAEAVLASMAASLDGAHGFSTFSASTYDTAWVAMVGRLDSNGSLELMFPECFDFLLQTQQADGSWRSESGSVLDGILNTMAALLAVQKRIASISGPSSSDLAARCARAEAVLVRMLRSWDVASCDRVGFEVIVPALMRLLEQYGYHFAKELSGKHGKSLTSLYEKKVSKFFPVLFSDNPTTLIHSLEAFAGKLDYDKVKHHRSPRGDMLGSPSSTAAYLMFATTWDEVAAGYLHSVVTAMAPQLGKGGVPSAFPTHIFEVTWVLTTLLESGFTISDLGENNIARTKSYLLHILEAQGGVIGFAPHALPDADDLSMTISVFSLLGESVSVEGLLTNFETPTHFVSYPGERNASFSVNCNVLLCLLRREDVSLFTGQVVKAASFLAQLWYDSEVKDKWNTSNYYPMMLLAKAFVMFLDRWESKALDRSQISEELLRERIPVILFDILLKVLDSQEEDGSWSRQREPTAYAILALTALRRLPWVDPFAPEIHSRVRRGNDYLIGSKYLWRHGDHIWIEKIAYSNSNLALAYCLAATKSAEGMKRTTCLGQEISDLLSSSPKMVKSFQMFFSGVPTFSEVPSWKLKLWILQAFQFCRRLGRAGLDMSIPRNASDDKYLAYIPFTWIATCNGSQRMPLSSQWEMMVCSVLNYQVDEFMEFSVSQEHSEDIGHFKSAVHRLCLPRRPETAARSLESQNSKTSLDQCPAEETNSHGDLTPPDSEADAAIREAEDTIAQFVDHFLCHPKVVRSLAWMQTWLAQQLRRCVLAHLTHLEDCKEYAGPSSPGHSHTTKPWTYFDWVHSTPADNTTAKFSFVFYLCLILGERGDKLLGNGEETKASYFPRYMAEDMCNHLAAMCRQQNDYGSISRDRAEGGLNSADFADLYLGGIDGDGDDRICAAKEMLLDVAAYERACLQNSMMELGKYLDSGVIDALRVFIDITDLYGQIYIVKDRGPGA